MARRFIRPRLIDLSGNVLRGGWLHVYDAGTLNETDVYAASAGGAPLVQPLTTDVRGECELWLDAGTSVDLAWSDSGATYRSGTTRRAVFDAFSEFVDADPVVAASTLHASLTDLATSGHPASVISGLGDAAAKNTGTTAGTVAAGDDSRITGAVQVSTYDAQSILAAVADNAPTALTVGQQTLVGRITGGDIAALSASQVKTLLAIAAGDVSGLGGAAVLSVGTTAGTVAAGDDSRITGAVPKSLIDAAGDLLVGSAADTVARLPLGSAAQVLRVNAGGTGLEYGTPAAAGPLAVTQYDPSSTVAHSTTSATAVDIDASNLAVTFTVPASGAVLVSLNALFRQSSETWSGGWSLREGTSEVAAAYSVMEGWTTAPTGVHQSNKRLTYRRKFTGLTPGASLTWKWAAKTSGGTSTTTYGLSGGGQPAVMEVWAA